jgi:class 3 adenylate cyclase
LDTGSQFRIIEGRITCGASRGGWLFRPLDITQIQILFFEIWIVSEPRLKMPGRYNAPMPPQLQFATTSDGVRIAFAVLGSGPPLLVTCAPAFGSIEHEWDIPEARNWYESLARKRTLILYDGRGLGASDRNVSAYSVETLALDIEAVIEHLHLQSLDIFGFYHTGLGAIVYAANHPERVRRLVLWHAYARASDLDASPLLEAVRSLRDASWEVYTETLARTAVGWTRDESASRWAALIRAATTPAEVAKWSQYQRQFDVTAYLSRVQCPTLLLYRKDAKRYSADLGISLASQIPAAQLQLLPGDALVMWETDVVLQILDDFLAEGQPRAFMSQPSQTGSIVTILFAQVDIPSPAGREEDDGDSDARREYDAIVRDQLRRHGGSGIKRVGDGMMASFASAYGALECAIQTQRAFEARNGASDSPAGLRIGLNAGEPMAEDDDLFSSAVILASRAAGRARAGEIIVTDVVRQLAAGKGFLFSDLGDVEIRGYEDPVSLFELRW